MAPAAFGIRMRACPRGSLVLLIHQHIIQKQAEAGPKAPNRNRADSGPRALKPNRIDIRGRFVSAEFETEPNLAPGCWDRTCSGPHALETEPNPAPPLPEPSRIRTWDPQTELEPGACRKAPWPASLAANPHAQTAWHLAPPPPMAPSRLVASR